MARAIAGEGAPDHAQRRWGVDAYIAATSLVEKAAVSAFTTANLESVQSAHEFISAVVERSVFGQMPELRKIPLNTRLFASTSNASGGFTAEGAPRALSRMTLVNGSMAPLKCSATIVVSKEQLQVSDPEAESWFVAELTGAVADAISEAFLDPTNAGSAGVKPASVTSGVTPTTATANASADLKALFADFGGDLASAYVVALPKTLVSLSGAARPYVGARGGDLAGVPCIGTRNFTGTGGEHVALIDAAGIGMGISGLDVAVSNQGSVEASDSPGGPASLLSLWQSNLVGIRVDMFVNWHVMRTGAVALLSGASY